MEKTFITLVLAVLGYDTKGQLKKKKKQKWTSRTASN